MSLSTGTVAAGAAALGVLALVLFGDKDANASPAPPQGLVPGLPQGVTPATPGIAPAPPVGPLHTATDGTTVLEPAIGAAILAQLGTHSAVPIDPTSVGLDPGGGAIEAFETGAPQFLGSAAAWIAQAIAAGAFVLIALRPDRKIFHAVGPEGLAETRGPNPRAAVLASPPPGLQRPAAGPVPSPGAPPPVAVPRELERLPPDLQGQAMQALTTGTSRDLVVLSDAFATTPGASAASNYLRQKGAEKYGLEKARAKLDGRTFQVRASLYPSDVAQHYTADFQRWPELLNANPFLRRQGDNIAPWKGELIVPDGWDFTRGQPPQPNRARRVEPAPQRPPAGTPAAESGKGRFPRAAPPAGTPAAESGRGRYPQPSPARNA